MPLLALAAVFLGVAIMIFVEAKGWTFYRDEWAYVIYRRGHDVDVFLRPHNDHLSLVPVLLYKVFFETVGLAPYYPYMTVIVAVNLLCGALLFRLVRPTVGDWPAVALAALLVTLGPAWEDILWPFQVGFLGSVASGLGVLLALRRNDAGGDLLAALLLVVSLACSGVGVAFLLAAVVEVVAARERLGGRLLRVAAGPIVLYAAWYLTYRDDIASYHDALGRGSLLKVDPLLGVPRFVTESIPTVVSSFTGLSRAWGPALTLAVAIFLIRRQSSRPIAPQVWTGLALIVGFFAFTGFGRGALGDPASSRYIYPGAAILVVVVVALLGRIDLRGRALGLLAVGAVIAIWANVGELKRSDQLDETSAYVRPKLAAVELARGRVDPQFQPDPIRAPDVRAAGYLAAVDSWGSPADSIAELERRPPPIRMETDATLTAALRLELRPGSVRCPGSAPPGGADPLELEAPAGSTVGVRAPSSAPIELRLRRFGDGYGEAPFGTVRAGSSSRLDIPPDNATSPWHLELRGDVDVTACVVSGG